jgi:hypothetical protein
MTGRSRLGGPVVGILVTVAIAAGCAATEEELEDQEGAATQGQTTDVFEQARICASRFGVLSSSRDSDLQNGVVRWQCGDVPSVTMSECANDPKRIAENERACAVEVDRDVALGDCGDGFGQEFCEYNAVSEGRVVNTAESVKLLNRAVIREYGAECVFTSITPDVKRPRSLVLTSADVESAKYHKELANTSVKPLLRNATSPDGIEGRVAGMKQGVNSREAAETLIARCSSLGRDGAARTERNAARQALCFRAFADATKSEDKDRLRGACSHKDLSDDGNWKATGLTDRALSEADKDIAACTMVTKAKGAVEWRNSDPTICARAYRATKECNVTFRPIGEASPTFRGFEMLGASKTGELDRRCRYPSIDGKASHNLIVCNLSPNDVQRAMVDRIPLQNVCNQEFGRNIALVAPIGALSILSKAKTDTPFCSAFVAGARAASAE